MSDRMSRWEERFQEMEQEWREIRQQNMEDVTTAWDQAMKEMSREYRTRLLRFVGERAVGFLHYHPTGTG